MVNSSTCGQNSDLSVSDAPRLALTLSFIEGVIAFIYSMRQLTLGGPYGPFLGLSLFRFIFLIAFFGLISFLGLLVSRPILLTYLSFSGLKKSIPPQIRKGVFFSILGGLMITGSIMAYLSLDEIQLRVVTVAIGYLGLVIFQMGSARNLVKLLIEYKDHPGKGLLNHPITKKATKLISIAGCITVFILSFYFRLSSQGVPILNPGIHLYALIYLLQVMIISLGLGVLLVQLENWLHLPALSRFWVGFCAAPFMLGSWVLCIATIFPGAPGWIFTAPPPVIALLLILLFGRQAVIRIHNENKAETEKLQPPKTLSVLYLTTSIVLGIVTATLLLNSLLKVIDRDALRYMAEGLSIAQLGSLEALSFIRGSPLGIVYGDQHGFMFPAILSHAFLINGGEAPGYPNDHAVRISFQILTGYMFLSMLALTSITRIKGTGMITWLLLLSVPTLGVISYGSYRDPLRIISYFLLAAALVGFSPHNVKGKVAYGHLITLMILAGFSISSHGASTLITAVLFLAWVTWHLLAHSSWKTIILISIFFGMGCLIAGSHIIQAYLQTGTPLSVLAENTLYIQDLSPGIERAYESFGDAESLTLTQGLVKLLQRDEYRLSIAGLLSITMSLLFWFGDRKNDRRNQLLFIGLMLLALTLPFLGVFDTRYYQWSKSYVYNYRYSIHWYPFAAVCLSMLTTSTDIWIKTEWMKKFLYGLITLAAAFFALFAYQTISTNWAVQRENTADRSAMDHNLAIHENTLEKITDGKRLMINDQIYNYYLNNQAILYLTPPTREIAMATNTLEVMNGLNELKIGAVIVNQGNIFDHYERTALYQYLDNPTNAYISDQNQDLRAYVIDPVLIAENNNKLTESNASFQEAISAYKNDQLERAIVLYQEAVRLSPDILKTIEPDDRPIATELLEYIINQNVTYEFEGNGPHTIEGKAIPLPPGVIDLNQGSLTFLGKFDSTDVDNIDLIQVNAANDLKLSLLNRESIHYLYYSYQNQVVGRVLFRITDDANQNFTLTWQDGEQKMFIDGTPVMYANYHADQKNNESFTISWFGDLQNLTVYSHALSSNEIALLHQRSQ